MKKLCCLILLIVMNISRPALAQLADNARDPIKPVNQVIFFFNLGVDKILIQPIARAYHYVPDWGRAGVGNFLTNLTEPVNIVNGILQLDSKITLTSFSRFSINTIAGIGGLMDVAKENGLEYQDQSFTDTLNHYGVGEGAYVVLPVLGPSTARDTAGTAADWFMDPVGWLLTATESWAQLGAETIVARDNDAGAIDQLYYKSSDPYTATRAAYLGHQAPWQ